jgi:ribose transport system ATP-binding protein
VDFDLKAGEVHVLLGENGAGKSTLVKILSGSLPRDSGRIVIRGAEVELLTPDKSREMGIGMVYQELSLAPALTVAENIFLGKPPKNRFGLIDWPEMKRKARQSLAELGVEIDPTTEIRRLNVAEQQLTEIARVLTEEPSIVLLDEPTSALSETERNHLFETIRRLQSSGVGIVYISHRLEEVPLIGQRVTVLRDGRVVGTMPVAEANSDKLIQMMVGRQLKEQFTKHPAATDQEALRVEHLSLPGKLFDLSFSLRKGEILGIFGLMGAGQEILTRALFGLEPELSGKFAVLGQEVSISSPSESISHGLGLLTRDRRVGLVPLQPLPPNITLARLSQYSSAHLLNLRDEWRVAGKFVEDLRILPPMLDRKVMFLSGGNQQKVVLARWLYSNSKVMIFDEPTRGIDVGAKAEVFALMDRLAEEGTGIIMVSSELHEVLAMADRILVMRAGRFVAEYDPSATQEELFRSASIGQTIIEGR